MQLSGPLARDCAAFGLALKLLTFAPTGAIVALRPPAAYPNPGRRAQLGLSLHLDSGRAFSLYGLLRIVLRRSGTLYDWLSEHCLADSPTVLST
jgi:hypothetical protein